MRLAFLTAIIAASSSALAVDVKGSLQWDTTILPDISYVPVQSRVLLDYGDQTALIRQDGSFLLPGVGDGHHVLTTIVPGYIILPLLLTVEGDHVHVQIQNPSKEPLPTTVPSQGYPIKLIARGKEDFFTSKAGFNPLGMLKNPIVLMMLVSGVLMFGLPKLTAYVESDPDMAREMASQRKKMSSYQNMDWTENISSMLAGESNTSGRGSPAPASSAATAKKRKGR